MKEDNSRNSTFTGDVICVVFDCRGSEDGISEDSCDREGFEQEGMGAWATENSIPVSQWS